MSEPAPVPADQEEALRGQKRAARANARADRAEGRVRLLLSRAMGAEEARDNARRHCGYLQAQVDQLASELREAREERDVFEVKLDGSEARVRILYDHLDWWRTKGKAAEANLIDLAKLYGEACSELQTLRWLLKGVADEADIADFLMADEATDAS